MTWGETFRRLLRAGHDHGSAAFGADKAEKRAERTCANCGDTEAGHAEHTAGCRTFRATANS
jgi:hypothetical protein